MCPNLKMIKFIFTILCILNIIVNTSEAIKFEDNPSSNHSPIKEPIKTNIEYIDDFEDDAVDERILSGANRNNRKKKSYSNTVAVNTDNSHKNGGTTKKELFKGVGNEKHGAHENIVDIVDAPYNDHDDSANSYVNNGATNVFTDKRNGFEPSVPVDGSGHTIDSANGVLDHCLRDSNVELLPCISEKTVSFLERYSHNTRDINIEDNLILSSNPDGNVQSSRLIPMGEDPTDFRTGLEAVSTFLQRRTIRYHLAAIYPGLFIVVNPNYQGKGVIEFQLDPRNVIDERQLSTSGLLIKRSVLPRLLGFKISIISIIPIIFAIVFFLTSKAMILSKLALMVTSFVGLRSIATVLNSVKGQHHHIHGGGGNFHHSSGLGGHFQQGHNYEDSILGSGALFGVATPVLAGGGVGNGDYLYRKPETAPSGEYHPEPELIFHTPGFKKEEESRSGKRVTWNRS